MPFTYVPSRSLALLLGETAGGDRSGQGSGRANDPGRYPSREPAAHRNAPLATHTLLRLSEGERSKSLLTAREGTRLKGSILPERLSQGRSRGRASSDGGRSGAAIGATADR